MRALVEKKTGLDGSRTLIHGGFWVRCNAGSIFAQDMAKKVTTLQKLKKLKRSAAGDSRVRRWRPGKANRFPPLEPCTPRKRGGERQFIGRFKAAAGRNAAGDTRERDRLVLK